MRVSWVDGKEQYEATQDFVVSPPSFRLGPEKSRMVRFKYSGTRQNVEGFYRLFVRQLPEALQSTAPKSRWLVLNAFHVLPASSVRPLEP